MKIKTVVLFDILIRCHYKNQESKLKVLKIMGRLRFFSFYNLINIFSKLKMNNKDFFCAINNKCFITSRSKGLNKRVKISRIKLKEFVNNGLLIGFSKYSW